MYVSYGSTGTVKTEWPFFLHIDLLGGGGFIAAAI